MNVLIIGLGSIAKKHIAALQNVAPEATVYALRSKPDAPTYGNVTNISDSDLDRMKFDFAIISNPTSLHAETIERLLPTGIPLMIEKPVFESLDHKELLEKIRQSGVTTYVACNLRFLDSLRFLHDYISSHPERRVNEVNVYCGSYLPDWRPGTDFRQSYSAIPELGGGVNIDLIHDIDYVRWIFGQPTQSFGICRNVSSLGIRATDYANYILTYPGFTASVILNYYRRDYRRRMEVLFSDTTWTLDVAANTITDSDGSIVFKGTNNITDTYTGQLRYFTEHIRSGESMENDVDEAYETLIVCLNYI